MSSDPTRMCEILVGLGDVNVVSVEEDGTAVTVTIETRATVAGCPSCGVVASSKGRRPVSLVDCCQGLRTFVVVWLKRRWQCLEAECLTRSWTEEDHSIAAPRLALTDRAGRWVTEQVGRYGRSVNKVAIALGCDWHTVNDTVMAYGSALLADPDRFGEVNALGLDEVLFVRLGTYRTATFSTQLVDVERGQLLDVVEGKKAEGPRSWLEGRSAEWLANIRFATLDLSGTYKSVFDATVPDAIQVADPFHVVKHATFQLDECRRRVQQELLGHRGRKGDPLYRARRLLAKATERLDDHGKGEAHRAPRSRRPERPGAHGLASQGVGPGALFPQRRRTGTHLRRRTRPRYGRQGHAARGPVARSHAQALAAPDRRLAHRPREQRTHRGRQQPHQAGQARCVRIHQLRQLPHPVTALRRQAQLVAARRGQPPVKSEEPAMTSPSDDLSSDASLIRLSQTHPESFTGIFERHAESLRHFLSRGAPHAVLDDLVSETFLTAFRGREKYDFSYVDARPWLFGIATNITRHHWRSEGRQGARMARLRVDESADEMADEVESEVIGNDEVERIQAALAQMDERYRDVLLLMAGPGLTYQEMSQALGIPVGTVRSRGSRGRGQLRELLGLSGQYEVRDEALGHISIPGGLME